MPNYTCSNCPYFTRKEAGGGDCRRFPPVPLLAPTRVGPQVLAFFPGVANSQYCFEHPSLKAMAGEMAAKRLQLGNLKPAGEAMQIPQQQQGIPQQQGNGEADDVEVIEEQPDHGPEPANDEVTN